ncbi:transcriptional repressor LexA [Pelobacter propionicus]|uniref:LexA repressor n=1 Tax=Pelobacter propionicus (strain DSM 2379 / NBRC 103807 / OttBd1) TaxID=338966 RepID=A1APB7_PELPD|nr:transcriptional repressor LexA [Pelobacter propionicus]ABK99187.1 SOS-response transcriptional repressor, LexA [Pelobacter propionicus DSM 2379]
MEPLSPRQKDVLDFLREFLDSNGYPPTLREIARHLDISGTVAVVRHLEALEKKGWIRRQPGAFRSISLVAEKAVLYPLDEEGIFAADQLPVSLPIVGTVRAGTPEIPREDIEGYLSLDRNIVASGGSFFLRIKGDSMKNAGMLPGDLVLIRPQPTADNGDVVVALVDGEATVKRFFREEEMIRLQPENELLEPILIADDSADVTVIGKVVSLFRPTV